MPDVQTVVLGQSYDLFAEHGFKGVSVRDITTNLGIAIDVTHASDHPEVDKRKVGDIKLGAGPVITRGANINPRVFELLTKVAGKEGIGYQVEATAGGTGTDANAIQISRAGVATGLVSVALRYMHTPVEVLSLADLDAASRLLAAFALALDEKMDFTP